MLYTKQPSATSDDRRISWQTDCVPTDSVLLGGALLVWCQLFVGSQLCPTLLILIRWGVDDVMLQADLIVDCNVCVCARARTLACVCMSERARHLVYLYDYEYVHVCFTLCVYVCVCVCVCVCVLRERSVAYVSMCSGMRRARVVVWGTWTYVCVYCTCQQCPISCFKVRLRAHFVFSWSVQCTFSCMCVHARVYVCEKEREEPKVTEP